MLKQLIDEEIKLNRKVIIETDDETFEAIVISEPYMIHDNIKVLDVADEETGKEHMLYRDDISIFDSKDYAYVLSLKEVP